MFWNTTGLTSNFSTQRFELDRSVARHRENCSLHCDYFETVQEVVEVLNVSSSHGADNGYVSCIAENMVGKAKDAIILHINCKAYRRMQQHTAAAAAAAERRTGKQGGRRATGLLLLLQV